MLSRENNELLCRVGPGAPMGAFFREFWWPVLRGPALAAGAAPKAVRVLGEDYLALRRADGTLALIEADCPRGRLARVLAGDAASPLPVREAGEMVWGWFGQGEAPAFPNFVFNRVPAGTHVRASLGVVKGNWLQQLENGLDPLHGPLLHGPANKEAWGHVEGFPAKDHGSPIYASDNTPPLKAIPPTKMAFERTPYGFRHRMDFAYTGTNDSVWVPTVMPIWMFANARGRGPDLDRIVFGHTPVDDGTTLLWYVNFNVDRPLGHIGHIIADTGPSPDNWVPEDVSAETNWKQDRKAMAERRSWSGLGVGLRQHGILIEDVAVIESMGPIVDRTKETLCAADVAIAHARQVYLSAVRAHMQGKGALGVDFDVSRFCYPDGPENAPAADELVPAE